MRVYPMITGIAIRIDDPEIASADHLFGLSLSTPGQNSEDRHQWRRVDPHPFLSLAFGPDRLVNLIDRLLMDILPRRLDWLFQRSRDLILNGRDASQPQSQAVQRLHCLHHISMAESKSSGQITHYRLRTRSETSPRHFS